MHSEKDIIIFRFLSALITLSLFVFGCASLPPDSDAVSEQRTPENDAWQITPAENSIPAYEDFLQQYPVGSHTIAAYLKLRSLYAVRDWKIAENVKSVEALTDYVLKFPDFEMSYSAQKLLESFGDDGDPRLKEIRSTVTKMAQNHEMKVPVPVMAIFTTEEPSYFVYKEDFGKYVRVGWCSVNDFLKYNRGNAICRTEYLNGVELPILKSASNREGIILFVNRQEFSSLNAQRAMDVFFTLVSDELDIPGDNLSILWLSGRGRDMPEILSSAILNDEGKIRPKPAIEPNIRNLLENLDGSSSPVAGKAGFLIRAIEGQGRFQLRIIGSEAELLKQSEFDQVQRLLNEAYYGWFHREPATNDPALYVNISVDGIFPWSYPYLTPEGELINLYTEASVWGSVYLSLDTGSGQNEISGEPETFSSLYGPPLFPGTKTGEESLVTIPRDQAENYKYPTATFYNTAFGKFYSTNLVPMVHRLLEGYFGEEIFTYNVSDPVEKPVILGRDNLVSYNSITRNIIPSVKETTHVRP